MITPGEHVAILASFFSCSPEEAAKVHAATRLVHYRHKDILAHQGDLGAMLWIVLAGRAQLQVIGMDGQIKQLASHGPGELFGAFPNERVVISDVVVQNRLSVLEITTANMTRLLQEEARIGSGLSRILGRQYNAMLDRMAARITLTANGRVYAELLHEAGEEGIISPPPVISALALSAQTTRETGSRAINALERRGIIRRGEDRLEILSRNLLEELVV